MVRLRRRSTSGEPAPELRVWGFARNQREVDEDLGDELRRAVEVHYVTRVDELLELALEPASSSAAPAGRVS